MPYRVNADTTIPAGEGENRNYAAGAVVRERDMSEDILDQLDSGDDDHLSRLLTHISEDEAERIERGQRAEAVIPEHEAEAQVLYDDGRDVLGHKEVIDLNPNGDPPTAEAVEVDHSEGREAEEPENIRVLEVDKKRRGSKPAPKKVSTPQGPQGAAVQNQANSGDGDGDGNSQGGYDEEQFSSKEAAEKAEELNVDPASVEKKDRSGKGDKLTVADVEKAADKS